MPVWKERLNLTSGLFSKFFGFSQLLLRTFVRELDPLRHIQRESVVDCFIYWWWHKHICHRHDQRLRLRVQSSVLQILERRSGVLGTVMADKYLHGCTHPIVIVTSFYLLRSL